MLSKEEATYAMPSPKTPPLTVDALVPYEGGILLIRRENPPFAKALALPGGFVEIGETAEEACAREALEETGLKVEIVELLGVYSHPQRDPRGHVVTLLFLALPQGGSLRSGSDAAAVEVVRKLPPLAFDHQKLLADAFQKSFLLRRYAPQFSF